MRGISLQSVFKRNISRQAHGDPQQRASANRGRPAIAATSKPGEFKDHIVALEKQVVRIRRQPIVAEMRHVQRTLLVQKLTRLDRARRATFAICRPPNGRPRQIQATQNWIRSISNNKTSYTRSRKRNGKRSPSSRRKKIKRWRNRIATRQNNK